MTTKSLFLLFQQAWRRESRWGYDNQIGYSKSHTGQREGPRWKTLVFVFVSLVLWYVPSSISFLCKLGSQLSELWGMWGGTLSLGSQVFELRGVGRCSTIHFRVNLSLEGWREGWGGFLEVWDEYLDVWGSGFYHLGLSKSESRGLGRVSRGLGRSFRGLGWGSTTLEI